MFGNRPNAKDVPGNPPVAEKTLGEMTKAELLARAQELDVDVDAKAKKEDIIAAIIANEEKED